jgi:hypothetical protein
MMKRSQSTLRHCSGPICIGGTTVYFGGQPNGISSSLYAFCPTALANAYELSSAAFTLIVFRRSSSDREFPLLAERHHVSAWPALVCRKKSTDDAWLRGVSSYEDDQDLGAMKD